MKIDGNNIRRAGIEEHSEVVKFYYDLIDDMRNDEYKPKWEKGIYPSEKYLLDAIMDNSLYIDREDEEICGAVILNNSFSDAYRQVNWEIDAADEEIMVIHTLAIGHKHTGRGRGLRMVRFAIEHAEETGCRTVRLDVLAGNPPARDLYLYAGFRQIEKVKMYYEDTGVMDFELYEYVI